MLQQQMHITQKSEVSLSSLMQSLLLQPLGVDEMTIRILDQMEVDGTHI